MEYRLARVELKRWSDHLARVLLVERAREALRILRLRLAQAVADQREGRVLAQPVAQLAVGEVAVGRAVVAVSVGMEMRDLADPVQRSPRAAGLQGLAVRAVAAEAEARIDAEGFRPVLGFDQDHATGGGAVERGERPAQHLDASRRAEREVGGLALPVGHGRGNAVGIHADPAHAESRARAEAARLHLQVLRVVLPVLHRDARHAAEALGQVDLRAAFANLVAVHAIDRRRHFEGRTRRARRRHDDAVGLLREQARRRERQPRIRGAR